MTTRRELRESLMRNSIANRAIGDQTLNNPQGNVIVMLGHCMDTLAMGCASRSWPELFAYLGKTMTPEEIQAGISSMHRVVGRYLKAIDNVPDLDEEMDTTFFQTLDSSGWKDVAIESRTAYLAMVGLYHLSRVWVVGRQHHEFGMSPPIAFETVAQSAGHLLRQFDQGVSSLEDGHASVQAATKYALSCGLTASEIEHAVREALISNRAAEPINPRDLKNIDTPNA